MTDKLRVCAYCRVSTELASQAGSFENQVRYFREYISSHEGWELTEIYSDEGRSGTSVKGREGFRRMISDAERGMFDRIITKEISRFARNTVDALIYVRKLRCLGIGVTFIGDGIDTLLPEGELRLTMISGIAQEESRRTSERVKWGQKRRMEQGIVFGRDMLGYRVSGGKLQITEAEAETVRYIFGMYINSGLGVRSIAGRLNAEGISPKCGQVWSGAAVRRILKNEKYAGDLIQGKSFTEDHLTHRRVRCRDADRLTVIRDHHEGIISREIFDKAQRLMQERTHVSSGERYSARYWCSGKIICRCGAKFVSRSKKLSDRIYRSWRCSDACGMTSLPDELLKIAVRECLRMIGADPVSAADKVIERSQGTDREAIRQAALSDSVLSVVTERIEVIGKREVTVRLNGCRRTFLAVLGKDSVNVI